MKNSLYHFHCSSRINSQQRRFLRSRTIVTLKVDYRIQQELTWLWSRKSFETSNQTIRSWQINVWIFNQMKELWSKVWQMIWRKLIKRSHESCQRVQDETWHLNEQRHSSTRLINFNHWFEVHSSNIEQRLWASCHFEIRLVTQTSRSLCSSTHKCRRRANRKLSLELTI